VGRGRAEETLTLTANAQPALMAVSLAAMRALEARGFSSRPDKVAYVAGHSLGEYSALAAAGTFSVADTARLLRIRGNAMQAAVPVGEGAMAAIIGLEQGDVEAACAEAATGPARSPTTMAAGSWSSPAPRPAVEQAARLCTEKGAKRAIMLPVSAPFHSALMAPAAEAMREALAKVAKNAPVVPVVANVVVSAADRPGRDRRAPGRAGHRPGALARDGRVVRRQRRHDALRDRLRQGAVRFRPAHRRDIATANVGTSADVEAALAALG
jgi:[acyl-carrier-protein] S-malonyltransferase